MKLDKKLLHRFVKGKPQTSRTIGIADVNLLCIASLVPPLPFVIYFSSLYFYFDPFYFILGDIIGDPNYQSVSSTAYFICFVLRAFLTLCSFECDRTITLGAMVIGLTVDTIRTHFQDILNFQMDHYLTLQDSILQFKRQRVVCVNVRTLLQECVTLVITSIFSAVVIVAWVVIKAHKEVPLLMYLMVFCVWFTALIALIISLRVISGFCERSAFLTWELQQHTNLMQREFKTVEKKKKLFILKKEARACLFKYLYYYPFLAIDEQFCNNTLQNLFRIFDVLMIF